LFKRVRPLLMVVAMSMFMAHPAWAISLGEAASRVARQYDGKVVSAQTIHSGGRTVHVIRILTPDGVVRTIRVPGDGAGGVDAHSGR